MGFFFSLGLCSPLFGASGSEGPVLCVCGWGGPPMQVNMDVSGNTCVSMLSGARERARVWLPAPRVRVWTAAPQANSQENFLLLGITWGWNPAVLSVLSRAMWPQPVAAHPPMLGVSGRRPTGPSHLGQATSWGVGGPGPAPAPVIAFCRLIPRQLN